MLLMHVKHPVQMTIVLLSAGLIVLAGCLPLCLSEAGWLCGPEADFDGEYSVHTIDRIDRPPLTLYVKRSDAPNTRKALLVAHIRSADSNTAAKWAVVHWGSFLSDVGITVVAHAYNEFDSAYGQFDLEDTLDVVEWLNGDGAKELGIDQVFLQGTSRGGVIAYQAAFHAAPDQLAGVIADRGVSNFLLLNEARDLYLSGAFGEAVRRATQLTLEWIGVLPEEDPEPWKALSASFNLDRIAVPMLVMHGDQDQLVPVEQAIDFVDRARQIGRDDIRLMVLEGLGHYTLGFAPDYRQAVTDFILNN